MFSPNPKVARIHHAEPSIDDLRRELGSEVAG